jgi:DNA-directed RNA polymerase specialized sigma24 family protein
LSPGQRAVLVLRDVYGWSHAEVSRELGITHTTAKVRLHRARKRVRVLLEGSS